MNPGPGHAAAAPMLGLLSCLAAMAAPAAASAVVVPNHAPTGDFAWLPAAPRTGDPVTLSSRSADVDRDVVTASWDLDGDGRYELTGPTATGRWTTAGPRLVKLRLTDARGAATVVRRIVEIQNSPPLAAFGFGPAAPLAGEDITFTSQSTDPDGGTLDLQHAWDLNGDGQFDDATGTIAHAAFPAGDHVVRLRVTDAKGAATISEQHVGVTAPVPVPIIALSAASTQPLNPFPVVRMTGRLTRGGVRVSLLSVLAPRGARIAVRCRGGGCPRGGLIRRTVPSKGPRLIRVRTLRRHLRAGARVEVRVTKSGLVGKYTRFLVRAHGAPRRSDRCLPPGTTTPRPC